MLTLGLVSTTHSSLAGLLECISTPITREGLHYKFTEKAVKFFQKCLCYLLACQHQGSIINDKTLNKFRRVLVFDSSKWDVSPKLATLLPGNGGSASKANCKIQASYECKSGQLGLHAITPGNENDQGYGKLLPNLLNNGDLAIFDLGYFCLRTLLEITNRGAFFLTRLASQTLIYTSKDADCPCSLLKILSQSDSNQVALDVFIGKDKSTRVKVRLICLRVPQEITNKRRMKLRHCALKKRHHQPSKAALAFCAWTLLISNAPASTLPNNSFLSLYRLRWQIELTFKQLKSILHLNVCSSANYNRVLCELYGKLIVAVFIHKIYALINPDLWNSSKRELSLAKLYMRCQERALIWLNLILSHPRSAIDKILSQITSLLESCLKIHQNSKLTSLQQLDKRITRFYNH